MNRARLLGLRTFHAIAEQGTLRAAAGVLGVQASAVSQQLKQFEDHIGTALFVRNTRSVVLTDAGQKLLAQTHHVLSEADAAIEAVRSDAGELSGSLRITLPFRAWEVVLAPRLAEFRDQYPEIELDLSIDENLVDIAKGGFHAGIRLGDFLEDQMIAKAISEPMSGAYVASPAYLEQHGTPREPLDLLKHNCIRYRQRSSGDFAPWEFLDNGELKTVQVAGHLVLNDLRSVIDAAQRGLGIGWSLKAGVEQELRSGHLLQVLASFTPDRPRFFLYFNRELQKLSRLRAFIDFFKHAQGQK
ncbi:LysR substrate-binding domain-containing protein [Roseibium sp. HPY-6]|uniref:LysR substrate-binding domain-containing protein n=1 Tax=Roseibium sp. HPY-6 TaxID=3229852 RepID=UPI003390718C